MTFISIGLDLEWKSVPRQCSSILSHVLSAKCTTVSSAYSIWYHFNWISMSLIRRANNSGLKISSIVFSNSMVNMNLFLHTFWKSLKACFHARHQINFYVDKNLYGYVLIIYTGTAYTGTKFWPSTMQAFDPSNLKLLSCSVKTQHILPKNPVIYKISKTEAGNVLRGKILVQIGFLFGDV